MPRNEFRIPDLGEGYGEMFISRWLKKPGDSVEEDDVLVILDTDKAVVELPSEWAGWVLEICVGEGDSVASGDVVAIIDTNG